jgi:serine/alanine adding enzyme
VTIHVSKTDHPGENWDAFARSQSEWTICHLAAWHRIMSTVLRHECLYLEARGSDGELCGILPLVRVKSRIFGHYLVSMPFLNYGGPLGNETAVRRLIEWAIVKADADRATLLQLRSRGRLPTDLNAPHHKITVVMPIDDTDPALLWARFDAKLRSQIRRPQKAGATVVIGLDQVQPFFEVFARNMRDLGTPTQSREFFVAIADAFGDDAWFGCVYVQGRPVAGGCGFRWANEFEMTWASSLREFNPISANMLLYWSFMEKAAIEGVSRFNFGRCTPGSGTHRFKRQWGAADEQLWWYGYPRGDDARTPSPEQGGIFSVATKVWRRMPLRVATTLGPRIVRYIP